MIRNFLGRTGSVCLTVMIIASNVWASPDGKVSSLWYRASTAESLIRTRVPKNSIWSFSIVSLDTGEEITVGNSDGKALMPASLMKLVVTAAALDKDATEQMSLDTIIAMDGKIEGDLLQGNLYIKGYGNALLTEDGLGEIVDEMTSLRIKAVSGNIVVDDLYFDPSSWRRFNDGPAYATPGALGLALHTVFLNGSGRDDVKAEPRAAALRTVFSPDDTAQQVDDLLYRIPGKGIRRRFALKDPAVFAGLTLKTLLEQGGIIVEGGVARGPMPSIADEVYRIESEPLSEVVKLTNSHSVNVLAENLLLLLGAKTFGPPGTADKGARAVALFLEDLGMPQNEINIADGSGLSEDNKVTTEFMALFLKKVSDKPWFEEFYKSLPRAGIDGTLKQIEYVNEWVRAKTGQTGKVFGLAGYARGRGNERLAFSLIVNVEGAELLSNVTGTFLKEILDKGYGY